MAIPDITCCPGTLSKGLQTYSRSCLNNVFDGRKVSHLLPYDSHETGRRVLIENQSIISISGIQEKFSLKLDKNHLRIAGEHEVGTHILKPIPSFGKNPDQMPANEHLTMQIARQVYAIDTAENALIFFQNGDPAYITKRFDVRSDGKKRGQEDFAALSGKTPQTHGTHFKYKGNYLDLFRILQNHLPLWQTEAPKLFRLILFNYLFSNGDAHLKNFSVSENTWGDHVLSPAYDLLNSRLHISDSDFALDEGLLPPELARGTVAVQFRVLADTAGIKPKISESIIRDMLDKSAAVESLIAASFLSTKMKRNYHQAYLTRLKKLSRISKK